MTEADVNSARVLGRAYGDDRDLAARQSLYGWQRPRYDLPAMVLDLVPGSARAVLDVGCGNGRFLARLRRDSPAATVLGLDIAAGILTGVPGPVVVGDAANLPVADGAVDVVLAMHMLYHVREPAAALAESVRVLAPGGVLVASTNAREDKAELDDLWAQAAADVLGRPDPPRRMSLSARFALDDAPALLAEHYRDVRVIELPGVISVDDPAPVVAHLASYRAWADQMGVPFEATVARAGELVGERISREGAFCIRCLGGLLVATAPTSRIEETPSP